MLTLKQRWALLKAAVGIFSDRSAERAYGLLAGILPGRTGIPPARGTSDFLLAYSTCPWLRAIVEKIAFATASVTWQVFAVRGNDGKAKLVKSFRGADYGTRRRLYKQFQDRGEFEEIENHPFCEFMTTGNEYLTGRDVRKLNRIYLETVGHCFTLKERNSLGAPIAGWPLPPHWVVATPTPEHRFFTVRFAGWDGDIPDTEILWQQQHNPYNPYARGTGIAQALADEFDTDEYAAKYLKSFFYNQARPDLVVMPAETGQEISPEAIKRAKQEWLAEHGGFWRAFKTHFARHKLEIKEIGHTFQQMTMVELRKWERDTILQTWGVSPEVFGIIENSNRATIQAADFLFQSTVVLPRLEDERDFYQHRLAAEYDHRMIIDYVSPVKEDLEAQLKAAQAFPWTLDADEIRDKFIGLPELEDGRGKVFGVPVSIMLQTELAEAAGPDTFPAQPPPPPKSGSGAGKQP